MLWLVKYLVNKTQWVDIQLLAYKNYHATSTEQNVGQEHQEGSIWHLPSNHSFIISLALVRL